MEFALGWNKFNLTLLGVWPEPRKISTVSRRISASVFWTTSFVTFAFICAPQTANLIVGSSSLDQAIENLSINVPILFALTKQLVLRYHRNALTFLVGEVSTDWSRTLSDADRRTMLKSARLSRRISIACSTLTYFMIFSFLALQIWSNAQGTSEVDLGGLIHIASFPYDTEKSPNFEITWLGQLIGTVLTAIGYSCFDTFMAMLVLHLCGQLSVLRAAIEKIADPSSSDSKKFSERLGCIVFRHNQLSRFAVIVEDCFNLALLAQTLIFTAMLCLTGYRMLSSVDQEDGDLPLVGILFFIVHGLAAVLHFLICCYVGETLVSESTGVAESAYDCIWYDLPPKQAIALIMLIRRSRISFRITAGKFSPFSMEFFKAVVKTAAGYLSVLMAMKE